MKQLALLPPEERAEVIQIASAQSPISAALLEKDFWVCWTLERLFSIPELAPYLLFKGGTTLSKAYNVIHRFSEDVDISVSRKFLRPDAANSAETEGISNTRRRKEIETLVATFHRAVVGIILPRLHAVIAQELETERGWRLVQDTNDAGTLHFVYPTGVVPASSAPLYNLPSVKIEMGGRSDIWPAQERTITP